MRGIDISVEEALRRHAISIDIRLAADHSTDALKVYKKNFRVSDDVALSADIETLLPGNIGERLKREQADLLACYHSLTRREQEVLSLLVRGLLNKQVGAELGITEYTVQIHRGNIMRKMRADSFAN